MIINVKDNRIPLARFLDICYGDLFIYDGSVHIKTSGFSGFRVDNGPAPVLRPCRRQNRCPFRS